MARLQFTGISKWLQVYWVFFSGSRRLPIAVPLPAMRAHSRWHRPVGFACAWQAQACPSRPHQYPPALLMQVAEADCAQSMPIQGKGGCAGEGGIGLEPRHVTFVTKAGTEGAKIQAARRRSSGRAHRHCFGRSFMREGPRLPNAA